MTRFRRLVTRALLLLCFGFVVTREVHDRRDRVTQESPVDFSALSRRSNSRTTPPEKPIRWFNGTHFDDRYRILRHLMGGKQGVVYLCEDTHGTGNDEVVVKTITVLARNPLPIELHSTFAKYTDSWPSEIDASLSIRTSEDGEESCYVPVYDYFITRNIGGTPEQPHWAWTLVTPFITGGTLVEFAHRLRRTGQTVEQLDEVYRKPFSRFLTQMHSLHETGFCHDDVKPQNIFIESPEHWLLGDLGNTRDRDHEWHNTNLWQRTNQWPDCRLNDVRRALKSYMFFLKAACVDQELFDLGFLNADTSWAKLYWHFMTYPESEQGISEREAIIGPSNDHLAVSSGRLGSWRRQWQVDEELTCISLWYKLWLTYRKRDQILPPYRSC